ncbi:uncharacterized protein LOC110022063 isoform X2 [Phalaenopsis equestris]|uniref:uncharacterized protein LOC110022063 isoform X2 n=1 Tax=Phalaenopsis equestris TaxID=78828 RepID=UPI0009E1A91E|nr:uncharacterized protein LOC110022063 isoform X2 [Phalaenopsis equestris]
MGKAVEKKKKKGRPSLLDLQKRSLRLQKLQEQKKKRNPNPSAIPNPYARFPIPSAGRSSTRRNPSSEPKPPSPAEDGDDTEAATSMEDDEDDDEPKERRKEKKLKLVLHLPHPSTTSSDLASYAAESNGTVTEKQQIDTLAKTEGKNSAWKATEAPQGTSDLGPAMPLPDKKLLESILDRLQKKDIYGVFSEPVDPEELPDYFDIIKQPMDFGTVRNRLSSGAYKDLEQFEKDVFLISSNGMRYNAPDTIYFRQARSIHELAKKGFESLRHEGVGGEREPKIVRRGRPPGTGKNSFKRPVGRPPAERTGSEFSSEAALANALIGNHSSGLKNDFLREGSGPDQRRIADVSIRPTQFFHSSEAYSLGSELKLVRNEDYSGSTWKGFPNYGKKLNVMDESRRNSYKQSQLSSSVPEWPVLAAFDGERKILLQVGFHVEYAYARSLARFAANLGPIGWKIAAKRIEKVLPSGIKFGPGWVGDEVDAPRSYHPHFSKSPSPHPSSPQSNISAALRNEPHSEKRDDLPSNNSVGQYSHSGTSLSPSSASISAVAHERFHDSSEVKGSSEFHCNVKMQPLANGFKASFTSNHLSRSKIFTMPSAARENFGLEAVIPLPNSSKGPCPAVPGVTVDSQKPDLALQL